MAQGDSPADLRAKFQPKRIDHLKNRVEAWIGFS